VNRWALNSCADSTYDISDGRLKDRQAGAGGVRDGCPPRVLKGKNMTFGMRHEAEDEAGLVADPGDGIDGTVGIFAVGQWNLLLCPERFPNQVTYGYETTFTVRDGKFERFSQICGPDAAAGVWLEADPLGHETAGGIVGQRARLSAGTREQAGFDQDLKAIADADDRLAILDELTQGVGEVVNKLVGKDPAGGDVVAVAEAAGDGQELETVELLWVGEEGIEVKALGDGAGELERVGGFQVAVGAGGSEDQRAGLHRSKL
jgi:hypothetical protein